MNENNKNEEQFDYAVHFHYEGGAVDVFKFSDQEVAEQFATMGLMAENVFYAEVFNQDKLLWTIE